NDRTSVWLDAAPLPLEVSWRSRGGLRQTSIERSSPPACGSLDVRRYVAWYVTLFPAVNSCCRTLAWADSGAADPVLGFELPPRPKTRAAIPNIAAPATTPTITAVRTTRLDTAGRLGGSEFGREDYSNPPSRTWISTVTGGSPT